MNASWIIPFIILGAALQSCGAAMNGQLHKSVINPWLASAISFALITFFFSGAFLVMPNPHPTSKDLASMP
jgi:transporter family-2 protein